MSDMFAGGMSAIPWTDKLKFSTDMVEIEHTSYIDWTHRMLPMVKTMKPIPARAESKDFEAHGVSIDSCYFGAHIFPTKIMAPRWMFGEPVEQRATLEVFQGYKRGSICFTGPVPIPVLVKKDDVKSVWMSLTPMEVISMKMGISRSRQMTVIGGMGLGYLARRCLERKQVKKLIVWELSAEILNYFGRPLKEEFGDRLELKVGSIYSPEAYVDMRLADRVLVDIWQSDGVWSWDKEFKKLRAEFADKLWHWGNKQA